MKTKTVNILVYEIGDILSIDKTCIKLTSKGNAIGNAERGMVVRATERIDKQLSYRVLCSNGNVITIGPDEYDSLHYIGHQNIDMLFEGVS